MRYVVITRIAPYEPEDECAEVTLDSGTEQIRVFAHACAEKPGDVLKSPLSALECWIEPAPARGTAALDLATYQLSEADFSVLLDTPAFVAALRDAQAQLKEHGAQAGFVFRSRALVEDLLPDIYSPAKDARTDAVLRHRIFESLARYALLDPSITKKGDGGGVRVVFNLAAGIRGMEHVVGGMQVLPPPGDRDE